MPEIICASVARVFTMQPKEMPAPEFILDYASPRPRGKLRLPARSLIRWELDPGGGTTITETLAGKSNAIGALIFGGFTTLLISIAAIAQAMLIPKFSQAWPWFIVCASVAICEMLVMVLVIDQTWAKTILRATREQLSFVTRSPLRRNSLSWHPDEVMFVRIESTQNQPDAAPLGQVQILTNRPPSLTLFVDHLHRDLVNIPDVILYGIGRIETPPAVEDVPQMQPVVVEPDERTFDRLMDVHRNMRRR
jgi:hypothetical protein